MKPMVTNPGDSPNLPAIDGSYGGGADIDVPVFLRETPLETAKASAGQGFPARVNLRALPLLVAAVRMGVA